MTESPPPTTPAMPVPQPPAPSTGIKPLRLLLPYLAPYKLQMFGALVALTVAGGTVLAVPRGLRSAIDQGFLGGDAAALDNCLIKLLVAILLLAGSTFGRYWLVTWLGERVVADLRKAVYSHILNLSPAYYETARTGDILSRLSSDTSILQSLIGSSISVALRNVVMLIGGIVMMFLTNPKLTGMVLLIIPVVILPIRFFGGKVKRLSRASQECVATTTAIAEETVYGIRTVQAFVHEDISRREYVAGIEASIQAAVRFITMRASLTALVIALVFSMIGIVLWVGGHDVLNHNITAGQLSSFILYATLAAASTGAISEAFGDVNRAAAATERIFELLHIVPTIAAPALPVTLPAARGEIAFENINFTYPARPDHPALKNISFSVKSGERVAIVGPSGAGKTTLYQLALRFYDPQAGRVLIDGVDVKDADPKAIRSRIGLVPQDATIFSGTAWHNIGYGREGATQDDIRAAARAAHADMFIQAMPQGYDTFMGEKGVRLSGGQRQRIAIARAILRNPSLLLLDEATSALDAESERLVQDALEHLMQGRTTLIIAHRLATVMNANRILVMENGQIVETGTHQSLIAAGGLYARLAKLQFEQTA